MISPSLRPTSSTATKRVRPLVHIGTNNNHGGCLLHLISDGTVGPVGGHISVGAMPPSHQVPPAGPFTPGAGKTHQGQPEGGNQPRSQTPGDQDPTTATAAASP